MQDFVQRPAVPTWVVALGAVFGALVLLFFMALLLLGVYGRPVPCDSRFLVVAVLAFGAALSASFLGGSAAASGKIPIPGLKAQPMKVAVAGGIAVLIIVMLIGRQLYMGEACGNSPVNVMSGAMIENMNNKEFESASKKADEILKIDIGNWRALNVKGTVAFYQGDYRRALEFFDRAVKARPDDSDLIFNLADTYVEVGAIEKAIEKYDQIRSDSQDWNYSQGRAYAHAKRYKDAFKLLQAVPNDYHLGTARVWGAASLVQLANSQPDQAAKSRLIVEAKKEFRVACNQSSEYWNAILTGRRLEKRESYNRATTLLEGLYGKNKPC